MWTRKIQTVSSNSHKNNLKRSPMKKEGQQGQRVKTANLEE
jgi:hypothetical protein